MYATFMHYPEGRQLKAGPFDFLQMRYDAIEDSTGETIAERSRDGLWHFNKTSWTDVVFHE